MATRRFVAAVAIALATLATAGAEAGQNKPIWADEFDGTALDESKWMYRGLGPRKGGVNVKEAVSLDGHGHLVITTSKVGGKYHTGMIATQGKHQWTYGYFECRVKFQTQPGHWSAFWLQSPTYGKVIGDLRQSGAEIDIFEYLARTPDLIRHNIHWDGYGKAHKHAGKAHRQTGLGRGWHTVGLLWTEKEYVFYVDGRETWRTGKGLSHAPQYIILSAEVGSWAGKIADARLPDSVMFDYVRVYESRPAR